MFGEALALPPAQRAAFLDDACADNANLRAEVALLLASYDEAPAYLNSLAESVLGVALPEETPAEDSRADPHQLIGQIISHYEVIEKLGGGGMGVVYKARDTKLGRIVALKFLPPHLSADAVAKNRFIHEAKAASALDHANLCTIHEIGETTDGRLFIVMAYYAGETLKAKIARGPLLLDEAVAYTVQMAQGLAKAHTRGIVHRDVKPANVMVTDDGVVKILDFGIAKVADVQMTQTGATLGTVAYMSPEQAAGQRVDHRTDLWSLGVVLYEMLTGTRPFQGEHPEVILNAIRHKRPDPVTTTRREVPPALEAVVMKCLEKDVGTRYQNAAELHAAALPLLKDVDRRRYEVLVPRWALRTRLLRIGLPVLGVLLALVLIGTLLAQGFGSDALPRQKHLVVLHDARIDGDSTDQAFTHGLVETVTRKLRAIEQFDRSFWVVPGSKVQRSSVTTVDEAWRAFDVNLAIRVGAEQKAGSLQVTLTLLDAETADSLRGVQVTRVTADLAGMQDEVMLKLAGLLTIELTPSIRRVLFTGGTVVPGASAFYTQGLGYLQRYSEAQNIDTAIDLFERALRQDSTYALAYAALGEAYWRKFENTNDVQWAEEAEWHCDRALERDDGLAPVYVTLGQIRAGRGRYGPALADFRHALSLDSLNVEAYLGLAKAYEKLERVEAAEDTYKEAIAVKPDYWGGYSDLGIFYYARGDYEAALEQFQHVIELTPLNASAYSNLGGMYYYLEQWPEAIDLFNRAAELEPHYVFYSNLATAHFYELQYEEAAQAYEKALELHDTDYRVWGFLASLYHWTGQHQKALQRLERADSMVMELLKVNPRDQEARAEQISYAIYLGKREQAISELEHLVAEDPKSADVAFIISDAYERLGEREKALIWIERALTGGVLLYHVNAYPGLADLRADARFQTILEPQKGSEP